MKLEIKHISPYLPYELYVRIPQGYNFNGYKTDAINAKLEGMLGEFIKLEGIPSFYLIHPFKPILRPLSDLTKEREHNGKKINPSIWLKQEWQSEHHIGLIDAQLHYDYIQTLFQGNLLKELPYWVHERLFEWNFDVFGLIDEGLAIDINTLTQCN